MTTNLRWKQLDIRKDVHVYCYYNETRFEIESVDYGYELRVGYIKIIGVYRTMSGAKRAARRYINNK